jgi:hypothetical protein
MEVWAAECGLTGDHTFLSEAPNLLTVDLAGNPALTLDKSKFNRAVEVKL